MRVWPHCRTAIVAVLVAGHGKAVWEAAASFPPVESSVAIGASITLNPPDCRTVSECALLDHPISHAVDGNADTSWLAPPNVSVNVTLDLGLQFEVQSITYRFRGNTPKTAVLYTAASADAPWLRYNLFAADCATTFSITAGPPISVDAVACTQTTPRESDFVFEPLRARPNGGIPYVRNAALQRVAIVRRLRLQIVDRFTTADMIDTFGHGATAATDAGDLRLEEIVVVARCNCNGHASTCLAPVRHPEPLGWRCVCEHNTVGATCDACAALHNRKAWARGQSANDPTECLPCRCHGRGSSCSYDAASDPAPALRYSGGGEVCNCTAGTAGRLCDTCAEGSFITSTPPMVTTCAPCNCSAAGSAGSVGTASVCNTTSGQCVCKENTYGRDCGLCSPGTFALSANNSLGCTPCECDVRHTVNGSDVCDVDNGGQCPCLPGYTGRQCAHCASGVHLDEDGTDLHSQPRRCLQCHPACGEDGCTGIGPRACNSCAHANVSGACVAACPLLHYQDVGTCTRCHEDCVEGCSGPGSTACVACRFYRDGTTGECVNSCPNMTYANTARECQPCDITCAPSPSSGRQCYGPGPSHCFACAAFSFLNGSCTLDCPVGSYANGLLADGDAMCLPCDATCDTAYGCTGPGPRHCVECATFESSSELQLECLRECTEAGHFRVASSRPNSTALVCADCNPQCSSAGGCTGGGNDQCNAGCDGVALVHTDSSTICVSNCPAHTTPVETSPRNIVCTPCNANCSVCPPGRETFLFNGTCSPTCPDGYYADPWTAVCVRCHEDCRTCTGPGVINCSSCSRQVYLGRCVPSCPAGSYLERGAAHNGSLVQADHQCVACHSQCVECGGAGPHQCTTCRHVRHNNECVATCPEGFFGDRGTCRRCNSMCVNGCSVSESPDNCRFGRCARFTYRHGTRVTCLESCNSSQATIVDTMECLDCHPQCAARSGCSGPAPTQCNACAHYNDTISRMCTESCRPGTFIRGTDCIACDGRCEECTGPGADRCTVCAAGNVLSHEGCADDCPSGYFILNRSCVQCHAECRECSGPSARDCHPPLYEPNVTGCANVLRGDTCVAQCDRSREYVASGRCFACSPACSDGCTAAGGRACIRCRHASLNGNCVELCPSGYYRASTGMCMQCNSLCAVIPSNQTATSSPTCYGPGPASCASCQNHSRAGVCVGNCGSSEYVGDSNACLPCNSQCEDGCSGPGPDSCSSCRRLSQDGRCVSTCSVDTHFQDLSNMTCHRCPANCAIRLGVVGCPGGSCTTCARNRLNGTCTDDCPIGTYVDTSDRATATFGTCRPCNRRCTTCWGPSSDQCTICSGLHFRGVCVEECTPFTYEHAGVCHSCDPQCINGCDGPLRQNCTMSSNVSALLDPSAQDFGCRFHSIEVGNASEVCILRCPVGTYADGRDRCEQCHSECSETLGCTNAGPTGCIPCPSGHYLDNASRLCLLCSPDCGGQGGCTGPTSRDCDVCRGTRSPDGNCVESCSPWSLTHFTTTHFTMSNATERICRPCDENCVNGCTGPSASDCTNCADFRNAVSRVCIPQCVGYTSWISGDNLCHPCHPQCDPQFGCHGGESSQCNRCRHFRGTNSSCVALCDLGERPELSPHEHQCVCGGYEDSTGTCQACHATCALLRARPSCIGPAAFECTVCAHARAINGTCTLSCPTFQTVDLSSASQVPTCTCANNTFLNGGDCVPCSSECAAGCTGPLPSDCRGAPEGCRVAYSDGACVSSCPRNQTIDGRHQCSCNRGFYDPNPFSGVCRPCHAQCDSRGCVDSTNSGCFLCANYWYRGSCVGSCPVGTVASSNANGTVSECRACHSLCHESCALPGDAAACAGTRRCSLFRHVDRCVSACPANHSFFVDCGGSSSSDICGASVDRMCVAECPAEVPFFNDSVLAYRPNGSSIIGGAQQCVVSCAELGRVADGMRCIVQAASDQEIDSSSADAFAIGLVVISAVACGLLVLFASSLWRRSMSGTARLDDRHGSHRDIITNHGNPTFDYPPGNEHVE